MMREQPGAQHEGYEEKKGEQEVQLIMSEEENEDNETVVTTGEQSVIDLASEHETKHDVSGKEQTPEGRQGRKGRKKGARMRASDIQMEMLDGGIWVQISKTKIIHHVDCKKRKGRRGFTSIEMAREMGARLPKAMGGCCRGKFAEYLPMQDGNDDCE